MKLIGYAREGRSSETLEQQVHCLMDYGLNIENIFKERRSSIDGNRPALSECIKSLEANDKLVITRLNQLARSIRHLEDIKNFLEVKNVDLIAIKQDLNTANKKMDFYNMVSLISEFEMDLRLERQLIGIQKAKNNGVKFGRKPIDDKVVKKIKQLFTEGMSIAQISLTLALGKSTIYRLLKPVSYTHLTLPTKA